MASEINNIINNCSSEMGCALAGSSDAIPDSGQGKLLETRMAKHTSGPLVVKPIYSSDNEYELYNSEGNFPGDTSPDVMDANARLFSSAPDLLEAAKEALCQFDAYADCSGIRGKLSEAIAKAEGK